MAPGKRPYHTLTPLMALRGDDLAFTLGTPGGDGQVQSLTQIINYLLLYGMTPQEAIEAPGSEAIRAWLYPSRTGSLKWSSGIWKDGDTS